MIEAGRTLLTLIACWTYPGKNHRQFDLGHMKLKDNRKLNNCQGETFSLICKNKFFGFTYSIS